MKNLVDPPSRGEPDRFVPLAIVLFSAQEGRLVVVVDVQGRLLSGLIP